MIDILVTAISKIKASSLARRFIGGAAWSVLGSVVSSGITLIMLMMVARSLGKETYGKFVVVQSTLGMVGVFAGFGIGAAATRYAAELKSRNTFRLGHILVLAEASVMGFGLIASAGLMLSAGVMATHLLNAPELRIPLTISAGVVLFTALDSYQKSVLVGFESLRAFAIGTVIAVIAGFPIMLIAAFAFGLQGAVAALVINAFLQASISRYQMVQELHKYHVSRKVTAGCLREWPVLWHFAVPALVSGALIGPTHWAAQAMLANTTHGYAELAVLGIAMQWFNLIMFVPGTVGRVVLPILTDYVTKMDHSNSRNILLYSMTANAVVTFPLTAIVCIFSPQIMGLYGVTFAHDYIPLVLAVITATLLSVQTPVGNLLAASSRMWLGALMNAGWALTYVSLAYCLADKGAIGILLALAVGYVIHSIWVGNFAIKELRQTKA